MGAGSWDLGAKLELGGGSWDLGDGIWEQGEGAESLLLTTISQKHRKVILSTRDHQVFCGESGVIQSNNHSARNVRNNQFVVKKLYAHFLTVLNLYF